jgi:hypothetical protein
MGDGEEGAQADVAVKIAALAVYILIFATKEGWTARFASGWGFFHPHEASCVRQALVMARLAARVQGGTRVAAISSFAKCF